LDLADFGMLHLQRHFYIKIQRQIKCQTTEESG